MQIDSLMNLVLKNCDVMDGEAFELHYDMIVLDESEKLVVSLRREDHGEERDYYLELLR